ncbi:hypothetical protein D9756_001028 [Leucocoprinus leucothites]|uniref:Uncharacterized protein n=1 Tax=Leucocoprinus leucothites TaxID=201217 RepID=A0A8H5GFQ3_9AGAR|nr:hypothetical protein D9756_001028 [Leucoagaricus leucothites]
MLVVLMPSLAFSIVTKHHNHWVPLAALLPVQPQHGPQSPSHLTLLNERHPLPHQKFATPHFSNYQLVRHHIQFTNDATSGEIGVGCTISAGMVKGVLTAGLFDDWMSPPTLSITVDDVDKRRRSQESVSAAVDVDSQ